MAQRQGALTPPGIGRGIEGEKVPGARKGWTRREFLKAVGIGAAAVATGSVLAVGAKVLEGMQDSGGSLPEPGLPPTPKPPEPTTAPTGPSQAPTVETPTTQPTKTETPKPTETATPTPTETPKPTPTPEAPAFPDRTDGRKNGLRTIERTNQTATIIYNPDNSPFLQYNGGIHEIRLHILGYASLWSLDARVVKTDRISKEVTLDIGLGRQITKPLSPGERFVLSPRVWKKGETNLTAYRYGGNISDLEEEDLVQLLSPNPDDLTSNNRMWALLTVQ